MKYYVKCSESVEPLTKQFIEAYNTSRRALIHFVNRLSVDDMIQIYNNLAYYGIDSLYSGYGFNWVSAMQEVSEYWAENKPSTLISVLSSPRLVWDDVYDAILSPAMRKLHNEDYFKQLVMLIIDHADSLSNSELMFTLGRFDYYPITKIDDMYIEKWVANYVKQTGKDSDGRIARAIQHVPDEGVTSQKPRSRQLAIDAIRDRRKHGEHVLYTDQKLTDYLDRYMWQAERETGLHIIHGLGGPGEPIKIYDTHVGDVIKSIRYPTFNTDVITMFVNAKSNEDFKRQYKDYLLKFVDR